MGQGAHDNVVAGNFIGTDKTGTQAIPNGGGIALVGFNGGGGDTSNNRIGTDSDGRRRRTGAERHLRQRRLRHCRLHCGRQPRRRHDHRGQLHRHGRHRGAPLGNALSGIFLRDWVQDNRVAGTASGAANVIASTATGASW